MITPGVEARLVGRPAGPSAGGAPAAGARPLPWEIGHLVRLCLWTVVGMLVVLAGWLGVSGQAALTAQFAWAALCMLGLVISGLANISWLLAGRRALGLRLTMVTAQLSAQLSAQGLQPGSTPAGATPTAQPAAAPTADPFALVASAAMTRFHTAGCPLVRGKQVAASSRARHISAGRSGCPVCAA